MFSPQPRIKISTTFSSYLSALKGIFSKKYYDQEVILDLEDSIQRRTGMEYCVAMPSARTSIFLVMKYLIKEGDEAILSPYTISDVVNMVICAKGIPVFADIDQKT